MVASEAPSSSSSPATQQHSLIGNVPPELKRREGCPFDPPRVLQEMNERSGVSSVPMPGAQTVWVVTGFEEARTVLTDARFSADRFRHAGMMEQMPEEFRERAEQARAGMFAAMDPPEHTRLRRLLTGQFTVRRMRQLEPRITEIVNQHLDAMISAGPAADLVTAFAFPVPSLVICELLGVPYADRGNFQEWSETIARTDVSFEEMRLSMERLQEFLRHLVVEKTETPSDDLLSGLIHGDADPALTEAELVGIGTLLLFAGHETTANMLGLGTYALLRNPEELAKLRDKPELVEDAVEELLRYLSIVQFGVSRVTIEPVEIGGHVIPNGAHVMLSVSMVNRDAGQFDDPDLMDLSRQRRPHLAFGHGAPVPRSATGPLGDGDLLQHPAAAAAWTASHYPGGRCPAAHGDDQLRRRNPPHYMGQPHQRVALPGDRSRLPARQRHQQPAGGGRRAARAGGACGRRGSGRAAAWPARPLLSAWYCTSRLPSKSVAEAELG